MPTWPEAQTIQLPERRGAAGNTIAPIELSVHVAGDGPAVVLSHGFPELAYSWRHQVGPLVAAGYRVIVPDQRGYGASDSPEGIRCFDLEHLTADLVGLLDHFEIEKAVFAGHDWGGQIVWSMPVLHPERTAGVIGVNTPYVAFPGTDVLRLIFPDPETMYVLWFQEPGVAEGVLDRDPALCFDRLMRRVGKLDGRSLLEAGASQDANPFRRLAELEPRGESLLDPEEMAYYVDAYTRSGFRGGVSWYRNLDRNRALFPALGDQSLELPCLMVTAEWDYALPPILAAGMPEKCSDLEIEMIPECGHWTQQEKPAELSALMVGWLKRRFAPG